MYLIYLYIYVKYIIKLYFCIVNLNRTACFISPRSHHLQIFFPLSPIALSEKAATRERRSYI